MHHLLGSVHGGRGCLVLTPVKYTVTRTIAGRQVERGVELTERRVFPRETLDASRISIGTLGFWQSTSDSAFTSQKKAGVLKIVGPST